MMSVQCHCIASAAAAAASHLVMMWRIIRRRMLSVHCSMAARRVSRLHVVLRIRIMVHIARVHVLVAHLAACRAKPVTWSHL